MISPAFAFFFFFFFLAPLALFMSLSSSSSSSSDYKISGELVNSYKAYTSSSYKIVR